MNALKILLSIVISVALTGCYTMVQNPQHEPVAGFVNGVKIENGVKDKSPRVFMTDGIVTLKSDYSKWTDVLISRYEATQKSGTGKAQPNKHLLISFQAISCGGSFVTNCMITVLVERSDGIHSVYSSTDNFYGYGWKPTMDSAIDDAARKMANDPKLNKFIYE
jgi:hypothetical protein